jgi:cell wall-associated NlpC family hydrolase
MRLKVATAMLFLAFAVTGCATRAPTPIRSSPGGMDGSALPSGAPRAEAAIVALAQLGRPYVFGGASPDIGFDCSGLVAYVYREAFRSALPRTTYEQSRIGVPVAGDALAPGDLVFFNTLRREFSHVGIYLGEARFVHAPSGGGVVRVEDMRLPYWSSRYNGARRLP